MMRGDAPSDDPEAPWVLVDASRANEIAFAVARPSAEPVVGAETTYRADQFLTFTDALLRFERESGIALDRSTSVVTIAGAISRTTVAIARSRWTISRAGLAGLFGRAPTIINDVAAQAWSALAGMPAHRSLRAPAAFEPAMPGRRTLVNVGAGVGAALIDIDDDGKAHVLDTEAGHAGFAPSDELEDRLLAALRRTATPPSWERVLMLSPDDPVWASAWPGSAHPERLERLARLQGSFAADLTLAHGAWSGVMMAGARVTTDPAARAAFDAGFTGKRSFRRLLLATPCWKLDLQDQGLQGGAALLARRLAERRAA